MAGWGGAVDRISGIIDGLLGLSPEEKKKKLRNKIMELEGKRNEILNEIPSNGTSDMLGDIDSKLSRLRKELQNCA